MLGWGAAVVWVAGPVPGLGAYLQGGRLVASPVRVVAGVMGQITLAMSDGLPVVATPPSIGGMHLVAGVDDLKAALKKTSDKPTLVLISRQGNNLFLTVKPAGNG